MRRALVSLLPVVLAASCINLDSAEQVKDLRLLAVRLDPPEILYSFLHVVPADQRGPLPLGPYNISATMLLVDPRGREVEVTTRLCPETDDEGCAGYRLRDNAPPEEIRAVRPYLDPVDVRRTGDQAQGGELALPSVGFTFSDRAVDYMLPHTLDGDLDLITALAFSSLPSLVVRAVVPGTEEEVVAFKRLSLALDVSPDTLPGEARDLLENLFMGLVGQGFCPPGTDPLADVQCIKARTPNHNPTIQRVLYRIGADVRRVDDAGYQEDPTAHGQFQDLTGRPVVHPGDAVLLRPVMGETDHESYQGLNFDIQSRVITLRNFAEDFTYNWYTTVGTTDGQSNDLFTGAPDGTWSVSPDAPDGPAHVWLVVRDQRGGVDWRRMDFEVRANPIPDPDEGPVIDTFEDVTGIDVDP